MSGGVGLEGFVVEHLVCEDAANPKLHVVTLKVKWSELKVKNCNFKVSFGEVRKTDTETNKQ